MTHENIVKFIGYVNFEFQNGIIMEFMERYLDVKYGPDENGVSVTNFLLRFPQC